MNNVINLDREKKFVFDETMLRAKDLSRIFVGTVQGTIDNWVRAGLISRYKIGGGVYYKLSEVKALIENSREDLEVG